MKKTICSILLLTGLAVIVHAQTKCDSVLKECIIQVSQINVDKQSYAHKSTSAGKWNLVWDDEFDYTGLPDPVKWSFETAGNRTGWGNHEDQYYTDRDSTNAWVSNGVLTITARKQKMEEKKYTSARLNSQGKGDWLYGRFEVRAKLPTGRGA
jgi:beta-glucanase (GH16 family)